MWAGPNVYRGVEQQKGMGMVPKRAVNMMSCQIARFLQLTQSAIIPVGYHVQRKVNRKKRENFICLSFSSFSMYSSFCYIMWNILTTIMLSTLIECICPTYLPKSSFANDLFVLNLLPIVSSQSQSEFHSDLFPDTAGGEPALTADQWCQGENGKVKIRSLKKKDKKIAPGWARTSNLSVNSQTR